jgi:hypothetical protein
MSLHSPRGPLLDSLREFLQKMEADPGTETPNLAELKGILRKRISEIEAAQSISLEDSQRSGLNE